MRTYSELIKLETFDERYNYLKLDGSVGVDTFGFDRYLNQDFYRSVLWKNIRNHVIVRDMGCDLGIPGLEIPGKIIVHHMNPIELRDLQKDSRYILDPEYLICVSHETHNAIHYGLDHKNDISLPMERTPNDTCPWRR